VSRPAHAAAMTTTQLDPVSAVRRAGGTIPRAELLKISSRRHVDAAIATGALVRAGRSLIMLPGAAEAVVAARATGGVISGLSAARHHHWKVKAEPRVPVITVPRNRGRAHAGMLLVRRDLPSAQHDGLVLTPVATVIDCARILPFDEALSVADSALRSRRVLPGDLTQAAEWLRPGERTRVLRVTNAADARAANPFESVARAIAREIPGLSVEPQGWVGGDWHSDLVDQALRIAIECDSWEHHADERAWRYDVRRYTQLAAQGWLVIRLLWEDVMARQDRVRDVLTAAVETAQRSRRT
jgi:very-short-patch-repair endonuclease